MQKGVGKLYKALICGGEVSLAVLDTTAVVEAAASRHALSAVAAAALGRTLTASAYLCSWLKEGKSSLSVSVNGNGAGGKIGVSGDGNLHMRGYAENGQVWLPPRADGKLDVGGFVGHEGTFTVIRDDGSGIPFAGTTALVSGEIAEDFSAYLFESEQRPTAVALGVKVAPSGHILGAGGLFLQPLPFASDESITFAEEKIKHYADLSSQIAERGAREILKDFGVQNADERDIFYRCHCSRKKIAGLILSLGREEAKKIAEDEGKISVHCHYCNTDYTFTPEEALALFDGGEKE